MGIRQLQRDIFMNEATNNVRQKNLYKLNSIAYPRLKSKGNCYIKYHGRFKKKNSIKHTFLLVAFQNECKLMESCTPQEACLAPQLC